MKGVIEKEGKKVAPKYIFQLAKLVRDNISKGDTKMDAI
jgi:hypothetical protein